MGSSNFLDNYYANEGVSEYAPSQNYEADDDFLDRYYIEEQKQRDAAIQTLLNSVADNDPDGTGEAQRLAKELGLPEGMTIDSADTLETLREKQRERLRQAHSLAMVNPILARQLSDPSFAAIAHDNLPRLAAHEKLWKGVSSVPVDGWQGIRKGVLSREMGLIADRLRGNKAQLISLEEGFDPNYVPSPQDLEDYARLKEINETIQNYDADGVGIIEGTGYFFGQYGSSIPPAALHGLTTWGAKTAIGTGIGAVVDGPLPFGEVGGAAIGGLVGFFTGWGAFRNKLTIDTWAIEGGHSWLEARKAGMTIREADIASNAVGATNAVIERWALNALAGPYGRALGALKGPLARSGLANAPLVKSIQNRIFRQVTKNALGTSGKKLTWNGITQQFAKDYALLLGTEVGQEIAQEMVAITGINLTAELSQTDIETISAEEAGNRIWSTANETMKGMILFGLIGPGITYSSNLSKAEKARNTTAVLEKIVELNKDDVTAKRNKDQINDYQQNLADQAGVSDFYFNAEVFQQQLDKHAITEQQLELFSSELVQQLKDAKKEGWVGKVVKIPTGKYLTEIGGTDLGNSLFPHVKPGENDYSQTEMVQFYKDKPQLLAAAREEIQQSKEILLQSTRESRLIKKQIAGQLAALNLPKITPRNAVLLAGLPQAFAGTYSRILGITPAEFINQYQYNIRGSEIDSKTFSKQFYNQDGTIKTETPLFKNWFRKSTLTNPDGTPQVVYHGTTDSFDYFDLDHQNRYDSGFAGTGVYLTPDKKLAERYARQKSIRTGATAEDRKVLPLYARLENPKIESINIKTEMKEGGRVRADGYRDKLIAEGHDGVIVKSEAGEIVEVVIFDVNGVKSIDNKGSWSNEINNIYEQKVLESFEQRGQQKRGRQVPQAVYQIANLVESFNFAEKNIYETNRDFKVAIQERIKAEAKKARVDLTEFTAEVEKYLVQTALEDARYALSENDNAIGWYDTTLTKAKAILSLIHPELATSPESNFAFVYALANTSNMIEVGKNLELAEQAYTYWKENGEFPAKIGIGDAAQAINRNFKLYNRLIKEKGFAELEEYMKTMHPVKEIETYTGDKVSGLNKTDMAYGAAVMGPKIGNGFFANLYGNYEQLTMDRWLIRTWGRMTGTLVIDYRKQAKVKREQLKPLIKALSLKDKKRLEAIVNTKIRLSDLDGAAVAIQRASTSEANRQLMNEIALVTDPKNAQVIEDVLGKPKKGTERIGIGSEIRKGGNALAKYNDGQKETPSGAPERRNITKVFEQVLNTLQQEQPDLTMADLQALLWYPEKRLYDSAKLNADEIVRGYEASEAPDYANASVGLAQQLGVAEADIQTTLEEVTNELERKATERTADGERGEGGTGGVRETDIATDAGTGLPLNPDGTVTVYHHTDRKSASRIESTGELRSAGEPDVYVSTRAIADTGYGDTAVAIRVEPSRLSLDDEFPNGRRDFRLSVGKPGGSVRVKVGEYSQQPESFRQQSSLDGPEGAWLGPGFRDFVPQPVLPTSYQVAGYKGWEAYLRNRKEKVKPGQRRKAIPIGYSEMDGAVVAERLDKRTLQFVFEQDGILKKVMAMFVLATTKLPDNYEITVLELKHVPDVELARLGLKKEDIKDLSPRKTMELLKKNFDRVREELPTGLYKMDPSSVSRRKLYQKWFENDPDVIWVDQETGELSDLKGNALLDAVDVIPHLVVEDFPGTYKQQAESADIDSRIQELFNQDAARGRFEPTTLTTILTQEADFSTFAHETAHYMLSVLENIVSTDNAPQELVADFDTLLKFWGVKDLETWKGFSIDQKREYHEAFAYNFELYLFEGKAPSKDKGMLKLFKEFSRFIKAVYQDVSTRLNELYKKETGKDLPILTNEVRSVMDRMLATDEQIVQANQIYDMKALFQTQEQSGMNDAEWAAYQASLQEAEDESIEIMTQQSMRQVRWLNNARSKVLAKLQKDKKKLYKEVEAEVIEELKQDKRYKLQWYLKRGETYNDKGEVIKVEGDYKLSIDSLRNLVPFSDMDAEIKQLTVQRMAGKKGQDVKLVADMFGFTDPLAMIEALLTLQPLKEAIAERTQQRMLEEHSGLVDERELELQVQEAIHNEARARFIAIELNALSKAMKPVRFQVEAAKQVAQEILAGKKLSEIRPSEFTRAEARALKATEAAMKKGDSRAAIKGKRSQLLNNQLAKEAIEVHKEYDKATKGRNATFKKFFRSDKQLSNKSYPRNTDLISAGRVILASYGVGPTVEDINVFTENLKTYDEHLYAELEPVILDARASEGQKDLTDLTYEEFLDLRDLALSLWHQSRRAEQIRLAGELVELQPVKDKLNNRQDVIINRSEKLRERRDTPVGTTKAVPDTFVYQLNKFFLEAGAKLRRMESWVDEMDGASSVKEGVGSAVLELEGGKLGDFYNTLWFPMRSALDEYRIQQTIFTKQYSDLVASIDFGNTEITANEFGMVDDTDETRPYTFGSASSGRGRVELLGALLHTGNASNKRKLLLGRKWGKLNEDGSLDSTHWDAFEKRMQEEGHLTKDDYDFVQAVWDLNEKMLPLLQRAHRDTEGYYFKVVKASPIFNRFGEFRGGYVPAKGDPNMTEVDLKDEINTAKSEFKTSLPKVQSGMTKERNERFAQPLSLHLNYMTKHIDDTLRYAYIQPVLQDTLKIINDKEFKKKLAIINPVIQKEMIEPWLKAAASQKTYSPSLLGPQADAVIATGKRRTGIGIMFGNLPNAFQQLTGLFPGLLKVKPKHLRQGLMTYMKDREGTNQMIAEVSPFMADRQKNLIFDIQGRLNELLINPNNRQKMANWGKRNGYFLQQTFQGITDAIVWMGTYNQVHESMPSSMSDQEVMQEAVKQADANVRLTQDSLLPEDRAAFQNMDPIVQSLTQFTGYFNMIANLGFTQYQKLAKNELGFKNKGKNTEQLFYLWLYTIAMPAVIAGIIMRGLGGRLGEDEDEDGYIHDDMAKAAFGDIVGYMAGLVPIAGQVLLVPINQFNNKPWDDDIVSSPSVEALQDSLRSVLSIPETVFTDGDLKGKQIRDVTTMINLFSGIPVTPLGRMLGYLRDVQRGYVTPKGPIDFVRGVVTGKAGAGK